MDDHNPISVECAQDSKKMLICPQTGTFMTKYRFSNNNARRIDLSPMINAVWLDKGEWALLKQAGLAGQLNSVFTAPWQKRLVDAERIANSERFYQEKFSAEDFEKISQFRDWLNNHQQVMLIRTYLNQ